MLNFVAFSTASITYEVLRSVNNMLCVPISFSENTVKINKPNSREQQVRSTVLLHAHLLRGRHKKIFSL